MNINSSSFEMVDLSQFGVEIAVEDSPTLDDTSHLVEGKKKKSICRIYETNWQCPGITMAGCSVITAIFGAFVAAGGIALIVYTPSNEYTILGGSMIVLGCVILGSSILNCFAHCVTCTAIGHYVPERAFETNIGKMHLENRRLAQQVKLLQNESQEWVQLVEKQQAFRDRQKQLLEEVDSLLKNRTEALTKTKDELAESVLSLEKSQGIVDNLESQLNQMKEALIKFGETNNQIKESLLNLDGLSSEFNEENIDWKEDLKDYSGINDEYERLNSQASQISSVLEKQLSLMATFKNSFEIVFSRFSEQTVKLDEGDDKVRDAAKSLEVALLQKEELEQANINLRNALDKAIAALKEFNQNPDLQNLRKSLLYESKGEKSE